MAGSVPIGIDRPSTIPVRDECNRSRQIPKCYSIGNAARVSLAVRFGKAVSSASTTMLSAYFAEVYDPGF